jgi:outer membrane immunogenic protein
VKSLRIFALAVVAILGVTSIASAGDTRGAPGWAGWYTGVNAGGGWGHLNSDVAFDPRSPRFNSAEGSSASKAINGALGGLQAGYNVQTGAFVFGFETDIQLSGQKGDAQSGVTLTTQNLCLSPCVPPPPTVTKAPFDIAQKLPWFGTLRGRVGVTPSEGWLLYATGGLAYGEIKTNATFTIPPGGPCLAPCTPTPGGSVVGNFSQTKAGWVVGAGVETALAGNWTGKLEYLHLDFGDVSQGFAPVLIIPFVGTLRANTRLSDDIVRVGVNYRFGG